MKLATGKYTSGHRSFILWLFGLIICYQVVYQFLVNSALSQREELTWGDICEASPSNSPHCMEVNIFRSWQDAAMQMGHSDNAVDTEEDLERLLHDSRDNSYDESFVAPLQMNRASVPTYEAGVPYLEVVTEAPQELVSIPSSHIAVEVADVHSSISGKIVEHENKFETTMNSTGHKEAEVIVSSTDPTRLKFQQVDEQALKYFNISNETEWNHLTPWAKDLVILQGRLEAHMREVRQRRQHRRSTGKLDNTSYQSNSSYDAESMSVKHRHSWSNLTDWSRSLIDLQNTWTEKMKNLHSRHQKSAHAIKVKTKSLQETINEYMRDMCMVPFRRNYTACINFFSTDNSTNGTSVAGMSVKQRLVEMQKVSHAPRTRPLNNSISEHVTHLNSTRRTLTELVADMVVRHRNMCTEVRAYEFKFCHDIFNESSNASENAETEHSIAHARSLRAHFRSNLPHVSWSNALHWKTALSFWKSPSSQSLATSTRSELRYMRWEGTHPSVACISVVPSGGQIRTWMKYFISNFRLQSYEGERQLILVYDYKNQDVGNFVRLYADGELIKAVPAFEDGELPSTTAFRFGMWTASDADVYARWDFNKWHDTHRLKMQVRSMAYTGRPASVLGSARQLGLASDADSNTQLDSIDWQASLLGEAAWMRENWHPLLDSEPDTILGALASQVVHVDLEDDA